MYRPREKADFTYSAAWQAVGIGLLTAALPILAYFTGRAAWESVTFTFLGFAQIAHLLAARSRRIPFLSFGLLALVFALQLAALYFPPLAQLLGLVPPTSLDLSFALVSGALVFAVLESVRRALHRMEALPRRD
jgi:Ca2+-transporting ATPase